MIVHFINKTSLPHTVHFHGDHPSTQDGVFEQVMANGTYTYDFIATPDGALMLPLPCLASNAACKNGSI